MLGYSVISYFSIKNSLDDFDEMAQYILMSKPTGEAAELCLLSQPGSTY